MRQNKYKLQVGDTLFEASRMRKKVVEWKIVKIFIEDYMSGGKVIFVVENEVYGRVERFMSDVMHWHDSAEEAQSCLEEMFA